MIKESTIKKFIKSLEAVKKSGLSISEYCKKNNISFNYFSKRASMLRNNHDSELAIKALQMYNSLKVSTENIDTDDVSEINYIRNAEGKIIYYSYKIFIKNKLPLTGTLTREEMNSIYRLYSYYGASLTQRQISRFFSELSLVDFKRILRAFNITKASAPFAPHLIEEKSQEELLEIQLREKENDFLRKLEEENVRNTEKLLKKYAQENLELKTQINDKKQFIKELFSESISFDLPKANPSTTNSSDADIIIVLSDLHIGAYNEKYGYIKLEDYNEEEITRRLNKIISNLESSYNSITICNLGDSVDSYNKQTTRGGHDLPTVISNKEQSLMYLKIMFNFFSQLLPYSQNIQYVCVGESNHDGDWGWINNCLLASKLKSELYINSYICEDPIGKFDIQDTSIIFLHGKDNHNQFKGFPLVLDFKTENWFNNYFIDSNIQFKNKKCVIKGDLHQFAYTCAKHFDYISAPSLYGSSNWIAANFGKTPWGSLIVEIKDNKIKTEVVKD